jgi:CO dehydrogenase nickel-insertion accessory protein CooC1
MTNFINAYGNLLVLGSYAHAVVNLIHIVGEESISTVLRNDTEGDEKSKTIPVALCAEEIHVGAGLLEFKFKTEGLSDLAILEAHSRVVLIAIGMVVGENCFCFFVALLRDQPTWGFRDPCVRMLVIKGFRLLS